MSEKLEYMEGLSRSPDLVASESDPLQFVRFCNYNVWVAGERLVRYWKARKEAFGDERAFLPLILTGRGALTAVEIHQYTL